VSFTADHYAAVLARLVEHYEHVGPACPPWPERGALLRHDVDLMLTPAMTVLADVEERAGVRSCWFVRVDGHYNPHSRESREVLRRLTSAGHRIGLHYDCATASQTTVERDRRLLAASTVVCDAITGHRPTLAARDPLRHHPDNPGSIVGHGYAADSRRTPLQLPDPLPPVLQVNTHPEHYVTDLPLAQHYAALLDELRVSLAA
jgi:hypothetical protein